MVLPAFFLRSQGLRKLYGQLFAPLLSQLGLTQLEMDILLFLANNPGKDTARDIVELRHLPSPTCPPGWRAWWSVGCWSGTISRGTGR